MSNDPVEYVIDAIPCGHEAVIASLRAQVLQLDKDREAERQKLTVSLQRENDVLNSAASLEAQLRSNMKLLVTRDVRIAALEAALAALDTA